MEICMEIVRKFIENKEYIFIENVLKEYWEWNNRKMEIVGKDFIGSKEKKRKENLIYMEMSLNW